MSREAEVKTKWQPFLFVGLILLLTSSVIGCPAPVVEEPVVEEPPIPAHFTTYTDEANLFSISYPPDWELALWAIEDLEQFTKELIESIESGLPLERVSAIFFAGVPTETGYSPNVNIAVESLPGVGWTLDKYVEAGIRELKVFVEDYHEFSRVKTTIGEREATIVEYEGTLPQLGKFHWLLMSILVGETAWTVTCATELGKFDESEDDFYAIVRSLRILK